MNKLEPIQLFKHQEVTNDYTGTGTHACNTAKLLKIHDPGTLISFGHVKFFALFICQHCPAGRKYTLLGGNVLDSSILQHNHLKK